MDLIAEVGSSRVGAAHCKSNRLESKQKRADMAAVDLHSSLAKKRPPRQQEDSTGTNSLRCYMTQIYSDGAAK